MANADTRPQAGRLGIRGCFHAAGNRDPEGLSFDLGTYVCSMSYQRECTLTLPGVDWAGGPGQSKDDVKWLDEQLAEFFDKY